jgi:hypothetical protein
MNKAINLERIFKEISYQEPVHPAHGKIELEDHLCPQV